MSTQSLMSRLAVCSWSLQPKTPAELLAASAKIGLRRLQCALDPVRTDPRIWGHLAELCAQQGVTIVSGMFGTVGEDYSTLESIKRTGGLVPDHTWDENWRNIQATVHLAEAMGLKLVTFHSGFLPHDSQDPAFPKIMSRVRQVANLFADHGISLGFETGQETAETLRAFLQQLNLPNVGVNFDPANMILYDKGDPIAALRLLAPWLRQCHLKDAVRTRVPGTWGDEVVLGTGQVDWPAFFGVLKELKFSGDCCIEREAGTQRAADIITARKFVEQFPA